MRDECQPGTGKTPLLDYYLERLKESIRKTIRQFNDTRKKVILKNHWKTEIRKTKV
jgi:hypothetical protein